MVEIESLGKYLKREREFRNISLKEVAKNTKVKEQFLKAIEEDQFDLLPSPTYAKGFLLAYGAYLGIDHNDVISRYHGVLKSNKPTIPEEVHADRKMMWIKKQKWMIGVVLLVSLIAFYLLFFYSFEEPIEYTSEKIEVEEPLPASTSSQIIGTTTAPDRKSLSLQLKAVEQTWMRIQLDDQAHREMTFKTGEETTYQALNRIHLILGNAGGLDLIFNGKSLGRFGKSGEVITLILTSQGVEAKRHEKPQSP